MEVSFNIPDDKVNTFSKNAKDKLIEHTKNYATEIINEAERLELTMHEKNAQSEITAYHVNQAANKFRSINRIKRIKIGTKVLKIIADLLIFIAGILFLPDKFITENHTFNFSFFMIFILIFTAALITTIISHFKEGDLE